MILWLLETFPLPSEYKEKENWNTKIIETTEFSPLDDDSGEIAEGNRPVEINIENNIIEVATWQDVFINFIKYIRYNKDYDFDIILDNQSELFKKEDTILKWATFEEILDNNMDLSNRYKTFDGKVWDKVKTLTEDVLFVHINISASTCMNRIANIMNKFNMAENTVIIKLKS